MVGMMILVVRRDTEIAFCPWSARLLSYLGLTGKEGSGWLGRDYCQTDKLGTTQYSDDNHLNWNGRFYCLENNNSFHYPHHDK